MKSGLLNFKSKRFCKSCFQGLSEDDIDLINEINLHTIQEMLEFETDPMKHMTIYERTQTYVHIARFLT